MDRTGPSCSALKKETPWPMAAGDCSRRVKSCSTRQHPVLWRRSTVTASDCSPQGGVVNAVSPRRSDCQVGRTDFPQFSCNEKGSGSHRHPTGGLGSACFLLLHHLPFCFKAQVPYVLTEFRNFCARVESSSTLQPRTARRASGALVCIFCP